MLKSTEPSGVLLLAGLKKPYWKPVVPEVEPSQTTLPPASVYRVVS